MAHWRCATVFSDIQKPVAMLPCHTLNKKQLRIFYQLYHRHDNACKCLCHTNKQHCLDTSAEHYRIFSLSQSKHKLTMASHPSAKTDTQTNRNIPLIKLNYTHCRKDICYERKFWYTCIEYNNFYVKMYGLFKTNKNFCFCLNLLFETSHLQNLT